ncbi:MAG: hypothetical protein M3O70_21815 [Actinomycetota bacterium]|nr:hypothetical protein [Actinomycetota bacterium]
MAAAAAPGRPPVPPAAPLLFWAATGAVLTIVILVGTPQPAPLDDPDPARQRTGVPIPAEAAAVVADLGLPGDPMGTRPVVVVFDRALPDAARLRAWTRAVPSGIGVVLVVPRGGTAAGPVPVVADPREKVADSLGMPRPVDAGPPVGYAIVDRQARVRYRTLDPQYLAHSFELRPMLSVIR